MDTRLVETFLGCARRKSQARLTLCLLENYACFLSFADFSKTIFFREKIRKTIGMSNSVDPDHARRSVGHDLGLNYLKMLSADDKSPRKQVTTDFRLSCDVAQMRGLIKCDIKCPSYNSKR